MRTPAPTIRTSASLAACCSLVLVLVVGLASAEVISVAIDASRPYEAADGYTFIEATMHGTIDRADGSQGRYAVPLVLISPDDGGNGVGIVDVPNSVFHAFTGFVPDPDGTLRLIEQATGGFLFRHGYTYAAVQWNKEVTDLFADDPAAAEQNHLAAGSIERTSDAWAILRDTAALLRDPTPILESAGHAPNAVDVVLSAGYSQSATLLHTFVFGGENAVDGELAFDGHLLGSGGFSCTVVADEDGTQGFPEQPLWALVPCEPDATPPADGSVVVAVITEGTAATLGAPRFAVEPPHWRQYELAGVGHANPAITPDGPFNTADDRNPIVNASALRAAIHNLRRWVASATPAPASLRLEGVIDPDTGALVPDVDDHGNALGGLRLPHMEQEVDGRPAGAPLGTYTGLNLPYADGFAQPPSLDGYVTILTFVGGAFTPFTDDDLRGRYPDHATYVERVARAADHLVEHGYLLPEDRDAYVLEAERSAIGR